MKKRIQIDSSILTFVIVFTFLMYKFPHIYPAGESTDNVLDFVGMLFIMKGVLLRMAARGFKKANSARSQALVTDGIYALTRNPMYLGSFYIGTGFVLIVWPWWTWLIFAALFYLRFKKQVLAEEKFLTTMFGEEYKKYCQKVSRVFPSLASLRKAKYREILNPQYLFSTKDARGLFWWPVLAVVLETIQENVVYYESSVPQTVMIFLSAMALFAAITYAEYQTRN